MRDNGVMRGWSHRNARALVGIALFLVVAASLGLQAHSGHHFVAKAQAAATVLSIADHVEPDRSLHLDNLLDARFLACPGCQAQLQVGGSHLLELSGFDRPAVVRFDGDLLVLDAASRPPTGMSPRAPPSC